MAHFLVDKYIKGTEIEVEKSKYSLYGIFSFILSMMTTLLISLIFGYSHYILIIVLLVLSLRSYSAGCHANTPLVCFLWTIGNYLFCYFSTIYLNNYYYLFFSLSCLAWIGLNEIPKYTRSGVKHNNQRQEEFKNKYIVILFCLFLINAALIHMTCYGIFNLSNYSVLISTCILANKFSLSDLSFKILEKL